MTGGASSYLSNSGILSNTGAGAFFQNTSNTGTLGVAGVATVASNVLLTGGTNAYLSNSGILSNTAAGAFFQNTSNTGTLGVAGVSVLAAVSTTGGLASFGSATIYGNILMPNGSFGFSNAGTLSNTGGAAFFQNTSNTGTFGVAGITTHASNILQTAAASYLSNAGIFSNASNVLLTGGTNSFLSNSGILSNTGAGAFFQNTSNTGTLGVAQATIVASNLTMTAAGGFLSNAGSFSNAGVTTIASNVLLTGGASAFLSNSGVLSNAGIAVMASNIFIRGPANGAVLNVLGPNVSPTDLNFCSLIQSCNNNSVNSGSELSFWTHGTAANISPTRAVTINSSQFVGINCNTPAYTLDINGNVNISGSLTGGGFSLANWAQFPAITNVALGFSTVTNGFVSNVATSVATAANFTTSRPVLYAKTDTGFGQADPANFTLWKGTWVKHTGNNNDQFFSLDCTSASGGWVITSVWEGQSYTGLQFLADVVTFSATGTSNSGYMRVAGITTLASNVLLTGGTSAYFSNSGILSNTGAGAFFQNTSNTGTLGVAGLATFVNSSNTGTLGVAGTATFASNINQNLGNTFSRTFGRYYAPSPYNSDLFITANMATTTADALTITGATYDSASYGSAAIRVLTTQNGGLIGGVIIAASAAVNTVPVNVATISASQPFKMDVNGTSRGAIYYSSVASAVTITPGGDFGVYYNLTASGSYTITVAGSQATSNIGKFYLFRNNSGGSLSVTFTGGTGITSPIVIGSNASASIVVTGTGGTYALF
jgi:hypothetical protein